MYYRRVNRGLSFTRPGLYVFGLVLLIGMIAVTTGINGLYVFLSAGLGGFIISGLLSEKAMKSCTVRTVGAELVDAQQPFELAFTVDNVSPWFTAFGLHTVFLLEPPKFRMVSRPIPGVAGAKLAKVPPAGRHVYAATCTGMPRGQYRRLLAMQHTTFPFGILEKFKLGEVEADLIVAPMIDDRFMDEARALVRQQLAAAEAEREFYAHRPYTTRDPMKDLDWKKSANRPPQDWVVKQYRAPAETPLCLDADWSHAQSLADPAAYELFLRRVRTALKAMDECGRRYVMDLGRGLVVAGPEPCLATLAAAPGHDQRVQGLAVPPGPRAVVHPRAPRLVVRLGSCAWVAAGGGAPAVSG